MENATAFNPLQQNEILKTLSLIKRNILTQFKHIYIIPIYILIS